VETKLKLQLKNIPQLKPHCRKSSVNPHGEIRHYALVLNKLSGEQSINIRATSSTRRTVYLLSYNDLHYCELHWYTTTNSKKQWQTFI